MFLIYLNLFRVPQYIKNIFVFAPLFFSFNFTTVKLFDTLLVFILFSFLASSIYIFNDLMDINEDKKHPIKKFRPIASEKISKNKAKLFVILIAFISLFISFLISKSLFLILCMYFIMNIFYSLKLKHIAIIDIFIIASGFVLRLFAGAIIINVQLSMWIIIMTFLLALFLALAKRRDDVLLSLNGDKTRKNIDGYNLEFVNASMVLMSGVVIVSYILYTVSENVIEKLNSQYLYLTTVFVVLGILRYMQITFVEEDSGSPSKIILNDRLLQLSIISWLFSFILIVKII